MEKQSFRSLAANKLFQNVDTEKLDSNSISGKLITIKEGEILFREGDPANYIYIIISGEINLLKKKLLGKSKSTIYQTRDFFGYEEYFEETSRTSTAVALRDTYLLAFTRMEISNLISQDDKIQINLDASLLAGEENQSKKDNDALDILSKIEDEEDQLSDRIYEIPYSKKDEQADDEPEQDLPIVFNEPDHEIPSMIIDLENEDIPGEKNENEFYMNSGTAEIRKDDDSVTQSNDNFSSLQENLLNLGEEIIDDDESFRIEIETIDNLDAESVNKMIPEEIQSEPDLEVEMPNAVDEYGGFDHEVLADSREDIKITDVDEEFLKKLNESELSRIIETSQEGTSKFEQSYTEENCPDEEPNFDETVFRSGFDVLFGNSLSKEIKLPDTKYQRLIEIIESINLSKSENELIDKTGKGSTEITGAEAGLFFQFDDAAGEFISDYFGRQIRFTAETGITGWCGRNIEPVSITDPQNDLRFNAKADDPLGRNPECMFCYPVKINDRLFGVIQLINSPLRSFSEEDTKLIGTIARNFTIAKSNMAVRHAGNEPVINNLPMIANYFSNSIKKPVLVCKRYISHLTGKNLSSDTKQIIDMLNEQIEQINDSVQTTINITGQEYPLHLKETKINELLNECSKKTEPVLQYYKCHITNEFSDNLKVKIDEKEFYKCYLNIIKNACESMTGGGGILVATKKERDKVNILIKDSGTGIHTDRQNLIFEPFISYDKDSGAGLGLTITKKILSAMKGEISVESTLGGGSTFIISLPVYSAF